LAQYNITVGSPAHAGIDREDEWTERLGAPITPQQTHPQRDASGSTATSRSYSDG